jgi:DNA-binding NarL/FixJ family response regulator
MSLRLSIVGEASDGQQALKMIRDLHPDVLLLDLIMPGLTGLDTLRELSNSTAPVRTILLTASIETEQIVQALQLGARAIVLKEAPTDVLFKSIQAVMQGKFWIGRKRSRIFWKLSMNRRRPRTNRPRSSSA